MRRWEEVGEWRKRTIREDGLSGWQLTVCVSRVDAQWPEQRDAAPTKAR